MVTFGESQSVPALSVAVAACPQPLALWQAAGLGQLARARGRPPGLALHLSGSVFPLWMQLLSEGAGSPLWLKWLSGDLEKQLQLFSFPPFSPVLGAKQLSIRTFRNNCINNLYGLKLKTSKKSGPSVTKLQEMGKDSSLVEP